MKFNRIAVPALVLFLGTIGLGQASASSASQDQHQGPPPAGYGQDRGGWDTPPQEFQDAQRRGFHDGIEGARKDVDNHRRPDVNNRDEYRHPSVPRGERGAYREGFRRGYDQAISHLMGGPEHR
jgi:Spy/CpxP family protein refolding chaperone